MLILLAATSLGAQACAPAQSFAEQALGVAGVVASGDVAYPGSPDAPGCTVTVTGGPPLGESFISVAAKLDQVISAAGWSRDLAADADGPDGTAAGYQLDGRRLSVSVNQTGAGPTYSIVLGLQAAAVILDPACLSKSAWAVDPASAPIQVVGCRPMAEIPPPGADGFITYERPPVDGADGGFTQVKPLPGAPAGQVSFLVQDNTGGSFTAQATVTGVLGADGYMEAAGLTVE
ncbi:MAG: hypothetical protein LPJ86_05865 [Caulobacteraceae bacterium]|nr:hypothetical protein [Caulobacteraceae bacterium]